MRIRKQTCSAGCRACSQAKSVLHSATPWFGLPTTASDKVLSQQDRSIKVQKRVMPAKRSWVADMMSGSELQTSCDADTDPHPSARHQPQAVASSAATHRRHVTDSSTTSSPSTNRHMPLNARALGHIENIMHVTIRM